MPYANTAGALATAGGVIVTALIDGTVMALDDQTLEELWSINVGTGINAPPMTYAVDGKQYIAIATGLTRNQMGRVATTPELKEPRQDRHDDFCIRAVTTINATREATMKRTSRKSMTSAGALAAFGCVLLAGTAPARAADVTYERLLNPEPQNWLTHHRDFSAQRHSPLEAINKSNVKNLKLLFAVSLGGKSAGESLEATPLVDDGFMYMVDSWGVVYKIDVRSGTVRQRSSGRWTRSSRSRTATAASRSGAISSSRSPATRAASSRPTRRPARSSGTRTCSTRRTSSSPRRRSRSRTRSSSAAPAATAACATGSRRSTPRPATSSGRPIRSRRRASPAARPGRTSTTPT